MCNIYNPCCKIYENVCVYERETVRKRDDHSQTSEWEQKKKKKTLSCKFYQHISVLGDISFTLGHASAWMNLDVQQNHVRKFFLHVTEVQT